MREFEVVRLERAEYSRALTFQQAVQDRLRAGQGRETLILLEHPPTLTLGRGAKREHVLVSEAQLQGQGVALVETDRGGDVTYHGPGQLVGYPILHLQPGEQDVRRYVRRLEEVVVRTLREFGITASGDVRRPGVWVEGSRLGGTRKIAALGVHLSRWYTRHGFAINVEPNLAHFGLIVPCGIADAGVTSMAAELDTAPSVLAVADVVATHFASVFERAKVTAATQPVF